MEKIDNEETRKKIELKATTSTFLNSLAMDINDPMTFNNFFKSLFIVKIGNNNVVYITSDKLNSAIIDFINGYYKEVILKALKDTFEQTYDYKLVTNIKEIDDLEKPITAKMLVKSVSTFKKQESSSLNKDFTFDNYVESKFNESVIHLGKYIVDNSNSINDYKLIFIYSKSGLGKTHFLYAVGNELDKKGLVVKYINPDIFSREIASLLKENDQNKIKAIHETFHKADVVMFDDFQSYGIGNKKATVQTIFNILDYRITNNLLTIVCADKPINLLSNNFDLRIGTRLSQGLQLEIKTPDNNDWMKILDFILNQNDINPDNWEKEAKAFLTRNYSTSIRALLGAIKRVKFYGEFVKQTNSKYTLAVLNSIFKDIAQNKENITPESVIEHVAKYYKISRKEILGKSRNKDIVLARHIAIFIIRTQLEISLEQIGKIFGNRDHSTIINAIKKIEKEADEPDKSITKTITILSNNIYKVK